MSKTSSRVSFLQFAGCVLLWNALLHAEAPTVANAHFDAYIATLEAGLEQHPGRIATQPDAAGRLRRGEVLLERLPQPASNTPEALLHHWRATAFAHGATPSDFERLMRDFNSYPQHFAPDVVQASTLSGAGDHWLMRMRVLQHHVITVVLDSTYDVTFTRVDSHHGYTVSRSTRIDEIASPGTPKERALSPQDEHGFLWRQNTYWTYEERDGGLYLQVESLSLTRPVPHGLNWAVGPYVESIPRESLEFTLRSVCAAVRK